MTGDAHQTLAEIRRAEIAEARRLEEAADQDRSRIAAAQVEADRMIADARQRGAVEAERRYRVAVADAERRAAAIAAAGVSRAETIRSSARSRRDDAVAKMLRVVLARPGEEVG